MDVLLNVREVVSRDPGSPRKLRALLFRHNRVGCLEGRVIARYRNTAGAHSSLPTLRERSLRLQMLINAAFYLFGVVLFLSLQRAHITLDSSRTPVGLLVLENFQVRFAFAFNVFVAFFFLHVIGWFVSALVRRLELRGLA